MKKTFYALFAFLAFSPMCYAIKGPSTEIASSAELPQFTTLVGDKGLLDELIRLAMGLIGTVAVLFIIIAGFKYLTASGDEEKLKSAKNAVLYSMLGMGIVSFAYAIRELVSTLKTNGDGTEAVNNFSTAVNDFITTILSGVQIVTGSIAILFIIVGAYFYLTSAGEEDKAKKGKDSIIFAVVGLIVMVLSRAIVSVFYAEGGPKDLGGRMVDVAGVKGLINSIISFGTSFVGGLAVLMLIYSGFLWITARGEEGEVEKAKKILTYSIIGIAIVVFSYTIVTIIVNA